MKTTSFLITNSLISTLNTMNCSFGWQQVSICNFLNLSNSWNVRIVFFCYDKCNTIKQLKIICFNPLHSIFRGYSCLYQTFIVTFFIFQLGSIPVVNLSDTLLLRGEDSTWHLHTSGLPILRIIENPPTKRRQLLLFPWPQCRSLTDNPDWIYPRINKALHPCIPIYYAEKIILYPRKNLCTWRCQKNPLQTSFHYDYPVPDLYLPSLQACLHKAIISFLRGKKLLFSQYLVTG